MSVKEIKRWLDSSGFHSCTGIVKEERLALLTHVIREKFQGFGPHFAALFQGSNEHLNFVLEESPHNFRNLVAEPIFSDLGNNAFSFIDLFSGIGGFKLALSRQGGSCRFASEWDNAAKETYFNNYGEYPFGDIRQFTSETISDTQLDQLIPDHHILAAGFPCQPFSRAGVSARNALNIEHGFNCDTQGTLFYDIARIASVKRPSALFLENVRNLKSHDKGRTFDVIQRTIEDLGYSFSYAIINSEALVPQKRIRCYMIAIRNDFPVFEFDMEPFLGAPMALANILENEQHISDYQISERLWQGHINRTERNIARGTGFTALQADTRKPANTLVARYGKDGKECLIPMENGPPRKLTKREAARLQGYPETFVLPAAKTPTYKQMGNSVAVPVVTEIASQLVAHLRNCNAI